MKGSMVESYLILNQGESFGRMKIEKAEKEDLQDILDLQYLAYQSEAKLFNNMDIPPLKQTLEEVFHEYEKGIMSFLPVPKVKEI